VDGRRLSEAAETLALDSPATPLTVSDHGTQPAAEPRGGAVRA
jgi:hypothetical protein